VLSVHLLLLLLLLLRQNEEDAYRKMRLRVEDVQGRNCLTNFWVSGTLCCCLLLCDAMLDNCISLSMTWRRCCMLQLALAISPCTIMPVSSGCGCRTVCLRFGCGCVGVSLFCVCLAAEQQQQCPEPSQQRQQQRDVAAAMQRQQHMLLRVQQCTAGAGGLRKLAAHSVSYARCKHGSATWQMQLTQQQRKERKAVAAAMWSSAGIEQSSLAADAVQCLQRRMQLSGGSSNSRWGLVHATHGSCSWWICRSGCQYGQRRGRKQMLPAAPQVAPPVAACAAGCQLR
jgi:hypothetical protein